MMQHYHAGYVQGYALRCGENPSEIFDVLQIVDRQKKLYAPI